MTPGYQADVKQTIEILQVVLATEIVCVLRYTMNAITATGISSDSVKKEFEQHAKEEREHMMAVAERINQLGGKPDFNPGGLATRAASEYGTADNLIEMIKENLIAERIAVDHYRELIRYFGDRDPLVVGGGNRRVPVLPRQLGNLGKAKAFGSQHSAGLRA